MFDALLNKLEATLRTEFDEALMGLVATARTQLNGALAEVARERARELAEVAREKADLHREIATMHKHKEAQEGHVVLNIGGFRYETSVQTLRRLPHTFFDAYFSGRYAQDVCADGSIFIDRDGEHFGQVLQYLRDGVVTVAEQEVSELDIGVLRWLRREFGFYCIELMAEQQEVAFTVGGFEGISTITTATMERYDAASGVWWKAASMATGRTNFALCMLNGVLYSIGGVDAEKLPLASVERYDPRDDTWSASPPLPKGRGAHCAVAVGGAMFVMGGLETIGSRMARVRTVVKFDIREQTWSEVAPMPDYRIYAGACVLESDVYILGGSDSRNACTATTNRYNVDTDVWCTLAPMPEPKIGHKVCAHNGFIYVLGGKLHDNSISSSVHRFDPVANLWSTVASMSIARSACASFVLNESIYVAGGHDGRQPMTSVERYDAASDIWSSAVAQMNQARSSSNACAMQVEINLFDSLLAKVK
jgi:N-acetylneuraminic acid mutarotase